MQRPFQHFDHFFHAVEIESFRQSKVDRSHHERLAVRLARGTQAQPQKMIHRLLEGFPRPAGFLLQLAGYVVVESKRGSHIMMLTIRHHDVNSQDIMRPRGSQGPTTHFRVPLPSLTTDDRRLTTPNQDPGHEHQRPAQSHLQGG